jgi:uncharacterized protein (TIGR00730 family)
MILNNADRRAVREAFVMADESQEYPDELEELGVEYASEPQGESAADELYEIDKGPIDDLLSRMQQTLSKLEADQPSRGDVKILSRTLLELRYAFKVFGRYRDRRKVTVFGSARTARTAPSYIQGEEIGRRMAAENWFVVTGAAGGIMEAGHRGAGRANSMGLNIMLPFEQGSNEIIEGDPKLVHMKYFFTRKLMFVKECDAVVCLPGGFGTLDEALEVLTLLQTGKRDMVPVILLDAPEGTYWKTLQEFIDQELLGGGMISAEDKHLYMVTNDADAAAREVLDFFKVYHSMRYVREKLVFRLNEAPSTTLLAEINQHFADILVEGEFELGDALETEVEALELPRLVFSFNRRNHGRLRQLINAINRGSI